MPNPLSEAGNASTILSLFQAVSNNDWESALTICEDSGGPFPDEIAKQMALRAAVTGGSSEKFVNNLVGIMPPDLLERTDALGRTALHFAAMAGNKDATKILADKRPELVHEVDYFTELPIHLAARHAHKETVSYLLSRTNFVGLDEAAAKLVKLLTIAEFYDIALKVLRSGVARPSLSDWRLLELLEDLLQTLAKRPEAFERRHHRPWSSLSAPHLLLRNSLHYMKGTRQFGTPQSTDRAEFKHPHAIDLLRLLIGEILSVASLESATVILGRQQCTAAQSGNHEAVAELIRVNPFPFNYKNRYGQNFLDVAVLSHQKGVLNLVFQLASFKQYLLQTKERSNNNNILHFAARRQPLSVSTAALQVQRDLHWFKEVERNVPPNFRDQINGEGKTPREVFAEEHKGLLKDGDEWMKKSAEACTVVAALVATVVFAAAFTVPGGNNDSNGIPIYLTDASFMTFAISDTLGLVSSITSLLMFLSILNSGFEEEDPLNPGRYKRLGIGLVILFFSIASMLVTFTASLQIVLGHRVKWIAVPIGILASVPVILFARLQFPILFQIFYSTFRSIFFAGEKVAHYWVFCERKVRSYFRCCS